MPQTFPAAGTTWRNPKDATLMRIVPGGDFMMGSTGAEIEAAISEDRDGPQFSLRHETPQFRAHLPDFFIGIFAVTNEQFARFLTDSQPGPERLLEWVSSLDRIHRVRTRANEVFHPAPGFERHPAICVSWVGASKYCEWAGLRLPTEMEWEKAARGTDGRAFPWGNEWEPRRLCWWGSHDEKTDTAPVDAYPEGCSPSGIFQMAGNVEEWCADSYQRDVYSRYASGDTRPPRGGIGRVIRGGNCLRRHPLEFHCAMRRSNPATFTNILYTGIRCASSRVLSREEP
jgi:formylglycine-generating enzyme required for sulfatase activity